MKWTAELIKTRRNELGMSQDGLAEALGVSRSVVQKWESGDRHPRGASVRGLDAVLGDPLAADAAAQPLTEAESARILASLTEADRAVLLRSYSDLAVGVEVMRRLAERHGGGAPLPQRDLRWDVADRPATRRQDRPDKPDPEASIVHRRA